jgi:hypothetical protein
MCMGNTCTHIRVVTTKHKVLSSIVSLAHERTQMIRELLQSQMIGDRVTKVQYTQRGTSFARGLNDNIVAPRELFSGD